MDSNKIWWSSRVGLTWYPQPGRYGVTKRGPRCLWSLSLAFWQKQKLQASPNLCRVGHLFGPQIWIKKALDAMSFWSHGHS